MARRVRLGHALHGREIEETQPFGRLDRPFRSLRREHLGQVEQRARVGAQSPRRSRGAVAEDRAVAEREHGRNPPPVNADGEMAHGVDTAVQPVQRTPS
jgi:hypothetical protein